MHKIGASRLDLARQFRARPFGPHSSELQKLLKILRWDPIEDRIIAVQQQRGGAWQLARSTGSKGFPIEIFNGPSYATPAFSAGAGNAIPAKVFAWRAMSLFRPKAV
jgi:hypothetical protein